MVIGTSRGEGIQVEGLEREEHRWLYEHREGRASKTGTGEGGTPMEEEHCKGKEPLREGKASKGESIKRKEHLRGEEDLKGKSTSERKGHQNIKSEDK